MVAGRKKNGHEIVGTYVSKIREMAQQLMENREAKLNWMM